MREYIISFLGASLFICAADFLWPGKEESKKKLVCGVLILSVLLAPLPDLLASLSFSDSLPWKGDEDTSDYEDILLDHITKSVQEEVTAAIKKILEEKFGVEAENAEIGLSFEEQTLTLSGVMICLSGRDIFRNPHEIETYFSQLLGCECMVVTG